MNIMRPKTVFIGEPSSITNDSRTKIIQGKMVRDKIGPTIKRDVAESIASSIIYEIRSRDPTVRASIAGSIRRHVEDIHDIDILVSPHSEIIQRRIESLGSVLWSGTEKISILLDVEPNDVYSLFVVKTSLKIQVDIRFIKKESWGPAIQYFTGSREHNISLRAIAKRKGLTLNEHGLFNSSGKRIDQNTEGSVYTSLGLRWLPPQYRNDYFGGFKHRHDFVDRVKE